MFANLNRDNKPRDEIEGCREEGVGWVKVRQVGTTAVSTKLSGGTVTEWKERKDALWLQKILKPAVVVACDPSTGHAFQASCATFCTPTPKWQAKVGMGKEVRRWGTGKEDLNFFSWNVHFTLLKKRAWMPQECKQERKPRKQEHGEDKIDYSAIVLLSIFIHYKSQRPMMLVAR